MTIDARAIRTAETVLPSPRLEETRAFFVDRLGFRVASVLPAEDPAAYVLEAHGLRVRLDRDATGDPGRLRLALDGAALPRERELVAPNGTRIELVDALAPIATPALVPSLVVHRHADAAWVEGRAAMRYCNLIGDRQGGRFGASLIRVDPGGPVADYVHYHRVRFQMIYCLAGWVRVVYEDQGEPFVLEAGDCVLQPPEIRHRVLEASDGLEVVEVSTPAHHETHADPSLELPNATVDRERAFGEQRFVRHVATRAETNGDGVRDLGFEAATRGLARARVVRPGLGAPARSSHASELLFRFVVDGEGTFVCEGREPARLAARDALVVPAGVEHGFEACSDAFEVLEVRIG